MHKDPVRVFWSRVRIINLNTECMIWLGGKNNSGYGYFSAYGRRFGAHEFSYIQSFGSIPPDKEVHHKCRIRCCVNPAHLEACDKKTNRGEANRNKTTCKFGHPFNEANTYVSKEGWRYCRRCNALSAMI